MMIFWMLAALTIQAVPADTPTATLDSATIASAYVDPGARALVESARARRKMVRRYIRAYETVVREYFSAGLRTGWLERLAYRFELATRIHWQRGGPIRMEVLGAREIGPVITPKAFVPVSNLSGFMPNLAFDPSENVQLLMWRDSGFIRHPLGRGSEAYYRFRSGDTMEVRLPDGREVRVIELEVLPRDANPTIIRGSLWFDADSHAMVRASFRLAEALHADPSFEISEDGESASIIGSTNLPEPDGAKRAARPDSSAVLADSSRNGPGEIRPDTAAADSGVIEPDSTAAARVAGMDSLADPENAEESEDDDDIGFIFRALAELTIAMIPEISARIHYVTIDYGLWDQRWWMPRLIGFEGVFSVGDIEMPLRYERRYGAYSITADSTPAPPPAVAKTPPDSADEGPEIVIVVPDDTASLLNSDYLAESPYEADEWLLDDAELEAVLGEIAELNGFEGDAGAPWNFAWSNIDLDPLIRYNRIEELSVGVGVEFDPGPITAFAAARFGTGDEEPRGALSITRFGTSGVYELTGYRRLETMDPRMRFSNVTTATAFLFGFDEFDYFDTRGIALTGRPPASGRQWYEWTLYYQRETGVDKQTDFSLPHLFDDTDLFRANPLAAEAEQYGATLALRTWHGRDSDGFRWGGELRVNAAAGDYQYVRPSLLLRTTFPLPGPVVGALEAGAGAVWGDPALQHLRRVGGTPSVRGYHGSTLVGESSWRLRAELATRFPAARLILFSDAGWAGPMETFGDGDPIVSVGMGAGFLDGFVRIDLARTLVEPEGWRTSFYLNGAL